MSNELRRARNRQMFIFLFVCLSMAILLGRLYYWQVYKGNDLAQQAAAEHIKNQVMNAPRGLIYDVNGHLLVMNVTRDNVYVEPIQFWNDHSADFAQSQTALAALVSQLHQILGISEERLNTAFNSGLGKYPLATYLIASNITPEQSKALRASRLSYVFLEPHPVRVYPEGDLAAAVLGYVGPDPNTPGNYKGFYGIEQQYNTLLSGKPGSFTAETDLNGNPLTVGASSGQPPVNGANLTLTLDSTIQYYVQSQLAKRVQDTHAQSGTAVVVNVRTGAIVAMASVPSFDPNTYGSYASVTGCEGSLSAYLNQALYCAYEPGSTMKAVTMAAGLDQGLITPDTTLNDPGVIYFKDGTQPVNNWAFQGYGTESMTGVLEHSANVGAAYVAHDILGPERYYPYLQRFGFGQAIGIDGPEQSGTYRTPQNAPANATVPWTPSDLARQAFGQSITATPLQIAMAYATIANDGVMMRPYLVAAIDNNGQLTTQQPQVKRRVISTQAAQELAGMLEAAANYNNQATIPGYRVAVKTGTATTQGISDTQTVASMAGFLPVSHPQFVILVKIDRPSDIYGGLAAGPLWRLIAQALMWHYNVPPDAKQ